MLGRKRRLALIIVFVLYTLGVFNGDTDTTSSDNGLNSVQSFVSTPSEMESLTSTTNGKLELVSFVGRNYTDVILNQDYKDIEIILVDDGSKDDSFKVISALGWQQLAI